MHTHHLVLEARVMHIMAHLIVFIFEVSHTRCTMHDVHGDIIYDDWDLNSWGAFFDEQGLPMMQFEKACLDLVALQHKVFAAIVNCMTPEFVQ